MCFMVQCGMSIVLNCSKNEKMSVQIGDYWRRQWSKYKDMSDEDPETVLGIWKIMVRDLWIQKS